MVSRSSAKKELYFPTKILKSEGRNFPLALLEKLVLKTFQWNVSIIIFVVVDDDTYYLVYLSSDDPF